MKEDYKQLLNYVLACIVSADNNMTIEEIRSNLNKLNKWEDDFNYRISEYVFYDDEKKFYREQIKNIREILNNELDKMNKVL